MGERRFLASIRKRNLLVWCPETWSEAQSTLQGCVICGSRKGSLHKPLKDLPVIQEQSQSDETRPRDLSRHAKLQQMAKAYATLIFDVRQGKTSHERWRVSEYKGCIVGAWKAVQMPRNKWSVVGFVRLKLGKTVSLDMILNSHQQ